MYLRRPVAHRNQIWKDDHLQAPVQGRLVRPWVTWFVDVDTNAVCGTAVTPGPPSRESILAAMALEDLPGYRPHLKGTVETLNGAAERMFMAGLPRSPALGGTRAVG